MIFVPYVPVEPSTTQTNEVSRFSQIKEAMSPLKLLFPQRILCLDNCYRNFYHISLLMIGIFLGVVCLQMTSDLRVELTGKY